MSELSIWRPRDLPATFDILNGTKLQNIDYLRLFINEYAASQRVQFTLLEEVNEMVREIGNTYVDAKGRNFGLLYHLEWRVDFFQVYKNMRDSQGVFVTFTGIVRGTDHPKFADWTKTCGEDVKTFHDAVVVRGYWLTRGWNALTDRAVKFEELRDAKDALERWNTHHRTTPGWAERVLRSFYSFIADNKEQAVTEQVQESNGTTYYNRQQLDDVLKSTVAQEELPNVMKFIDESVATWSRHLALNTHKKQTMDTPRFSLQEGPGIVTVLLERSDLDWAERAPQLQMVFSDTDKGLAISPRLSGGMTTSRMLDTFDQIVLELNQNKTVTFSAIDQVVTFVDHVADHTDSIAFREAIGDPRQALKDAGDEDPDICFNMFRRGEKKIHVRTLAVAKNEGEESSLLGEIILDDIGQAGRLQVQISEDSPKLPALARNVGAYEDASKGAEAAELAPVWKEVRATRADPDSVMDKLPPVAAQAELIGESVAAATALYDCYLVGRDPQMLKVFMQRLKDDGGLLEHDLKALEAVDRFIFEGGLTNLREWSYIACLSAHRTTEENQFLRRDNNAYIIIHDETSGADAHEEPSTEVLSFQCHAAELIA